jgi:disulfide oxidoreductase YuzD
VAVDEFVVEYDDLVAEKNNKRKTKFINKIKKDFSYRV